jgi:hypothetical protein
MSAHPFRFGVVAACVDRLREAADDRFDAIELNINLIAVVGRSVGGSPGPDGPGTPPEC